MKTTLIKKLLVSLVLFLANKPLWVFAVEGEKDRLLDERVVTIGGLKPIVRGEGFLCLGEKVLFDHYQEEKISRSIFEVRKSLLVYLSSEKHIFIFRANHLWGMRRDIAGLLYDGYKAHEAAMAKVTAAAPTKPVSSVGSSLEPTPPLALDEEVESIPPSEADDDSLLHAADGRCPVAAVQPPSLRRRHVVGFASD